MTDSGPSLRERQLGELSSIQCRFYTCDSPTLDYGEILVVRFEGTCGYGSGSNGDCVYMAAMTQAGLTAFEPLALVLDMRGLSYEWGDMMGHVLAAGSDQYVDAPFPTAVVVSDRCREGLTSLVQDEMDEEPEEWLFESLELACQAVGESR